MVSKILVVDDEPDVALLIRQRFRKDIQEKRIDFRFAGNGVEALRTLAEEPDIGIVLTDINMPEMDGLTLLTELTGRGPIPKAVMVSAYGDMDNIRVAMNRGAFDFVTKPIDFRDLQATIDKANHELQLIRQAVETRDALVGLRRELQIAASIQRSLLPHALPAAVLDGRVDLAAQVKPAQEVGGDFYDYFQIDERRLGFVVADVSGKGVGAAIYMAVSRTLLRAAAIESADASTCLCRLNDLLAADSDAGMFVTVGYGILESESGDLEYASAGHPPPFVVGPSGVRKLDRAEGIICGMFENQIFKVQRGRLMPGEFLTLYSDGVTEAMDASGELFSTERLRDWLEQSSPRSSCRDLTAAIIAEVMAYQDGAPQSDDITVLTLSRTGSRS